MTIESWFIYLSLVIIATATPGPAVLYIVTTSTQHGWKKASLAAIGNIIGLLCLGLMAVTGLGTLLKTSEFFFNLIKYAGSAYLIFLGCKLLFQKQLLRAPSSQDSSTTSLKGNRSSKILYHAFFIAMSNPKAIVFLTALFPQFINVNNELIPQFTVLILTLMFSSSAFLMLYAFLAHRSKGLLTNSKRVQRVNRLSGGIFIGFGALLAASSNS